MSVHPYPSQGQKLLFELSTMLRVKISAYDSVANHGGASLIFPGVQFGSGLYNLVTYCVVLPVLCCDATMSVIPYSTKIDMGEF